MKTIRNSIFIFGCFFAALLMFPVGFLTAQTKLSRLDDGNEINLSVGDTFSIQLKGNASTGFSWDVVDPLPSSVKLIEKTYTVDTPTKCGSGGVFVFKFVVMSAGSHKIHLVYARPWETKDGSEKTYTIKISSKE